MEIEVGNLSSKLITDNPSILEALYQKYGFYVPGYNYVPAYRKRRWDGKKRYFSKNGVFKTGLLSRIKQDLYDIGVDPKKLVISGEPRFVDDFNISVLNVDNYEYRDYQKEAIQGCLNEKRLILESPVASGKTLIAAGIVKSLYPYHKKMVILLNRLNLVKQTYDFFKSCGITNLGINSGQGYIDGDIMISMVQSIHRIIDTHLEQAEVLIVDEAHEFCKGDVTVAAIEAFPNAIWRIALTATPPSEKEDINGRMVLEGAFGPEITTRSIGDLIAEGKIAKPNIQIIDFTPSEEPNEDISYHDAYQEYIVGGEKNGDSTVYKERNLLIWKIWNQIYSNTKRSRILILVKNLEHLNYLRNILMNTYTVEGKDSIEDRYKVINAFLSDSSTSVLIGTNVLQTGISIDEITHMINARGLEGEIPTIQGLGRGLRTSETKKELMFYDFYDKVPYLETHSKKRIKHYKNLGFEINYVKLCN